MADDINLPNLVSHLAVNLDGVSGAVADASRQGSAMGAALGNGVHRQLDDLLRNLPQVTIDGNSEPLDRDLARIHRGLAELDAQRIGVDISLPDAMRRLEEFETNLQRIGDEHHDVNVRAATAAAARQLEELRLAARQVDDTDVDIDVNVDEDGPNRLIRLLASAGAAGTRAGASIAGGMAVASAAVGAVVPLAGAVVTTLANVAPAAGVGVTALGALQLASGTLKLAMVGVEDAVTAALDPSKAAEFQEALEKLSPEARQFAEAVRDAAPALRELQQQVQDRVFDGFAEKLRETSGSVLPALRQGLLDTGTSLNLMGKGVLDAAQNLGESGTLGQAVNSASTGLRNLSDVPGIVVTALGQIGAAAGPSFERLTAAAAKSAEGIGDRLGKAFESGAMQDAIERAVDLLGQMADIGGNVASIIGSIFSAAPAGGGLLGVLEEVTGAIAEIAASDGVQAALGALFDVMGTLGTTVAPLLAQALQAVAPVITALGPPTETLITALGAGLSPIIEALGPVLVAAAGAVGALVEAAAPLLPVVGELAASLLPVLTPLFEALVQIFDALAPSIQIIADILGQTLTPIFEALPALIQPLLDAFVELAEKQGPLLADLLTQLQPSFVQLGEAFGQVLAALGPLLPQLFLLGAQLFSAIAPYLPGLISSIAALATVFTTTLVWVLENLVVPALRFVGQLLSGDTPSAVATAGRAMSGLSVLMSAVWASIVSIVRTKVGEVIVWVSGLPGRAGAALAGLSGALSRQASAGGSALVAAVRVKVAEALVYIQQLPGRAASALGGLGGVLAGAGRALISGFISGIRSMIPSVQGVLSGLTSSLPDWKGPKAKDAKILTPAGRLLIEGFIKGIDDSTAKLKSRLASITKALPANVRSGIGRTLARATAELEKHVKRREAVIKKLSVAQKKLADLQKERSKEAASITEGILKEANIVQGNSLVNSVSAITVGLQQAVKKTKEFEANIEKLKKSGLRADLLQQIADEGVAGGAATAAALAKATPAELKKINDLQAQLAKSATSTGNTVGDALYAAGIRAAEGLVKGLQSQERAIENAMTRIAKGMLTTVKKHHKTHSPSRAFWDIGEMDGEGLRGGLLATAGRVRAAARVVAGAALDVASGVGGALSVTPSGAQLASVYAGGAGGDTTNNFHLYGSEASPDGILRALSWRGLVGRR